MTLLVFLKRLVAVLIVAAAAFGFAARTIDAAAHEHFTYSELTTLYDHPELSVELDKRLFNLLNTPFVNNVSSPRKRLSLSSDGRLGDFVRVAVWNIERGIEYEAIEAILSDEQSMISMLDPTKFPVGTVERNAIIEQARYLRAADVIVLNEADWGLKRSGYRNVAADLAARLGMNFAFGVEFVELSPVHFSRTPPPQASRATRSAEMPEVDATRYKGLHGTAILSRFPLENVRLVPFEHQAYDWFATEKQGASIVEKAKRKLVKHVFLAEVLREVRRGGRMMLLADIADPRFPSGRATVVAAHLESRTSPKGRQKQLAELLQVIKPIRNPVIVAGDMNTLSSDLTPTTIRRELVKRFGKVESWAKSGLNYFLGMGLIDDALMTSLSFGRNHTDPTVRHIPVLMPNEERKFFSMLKEFRFEDGGSFDFRGEPNRSSNGKRNTLANSNERDGKGFATTFRLERTVKFLGKYKLDWIFVKPVHLFDPSDYQGSYLFAPHFGRTLDAVNQIVGGRVSDHAPIIVDLPLSEPRIEKLHRKQ